MSNHPQKKHFVLLQWPRKSSYLRILTMGRVTERQTSFQRGRKRRGTHVSFGTKKEMADTQV
jgi:hypothetical protein